MKAILLAGALMLAALTTKTFAGDVTVTNIVRQSFHQNFFGAAEVQWSMVENLYRADFTADNEKTIAYFSTDGTLVATGRYIAVTQLSRTLQSSLKSHTASSTLIEVFEVQDDAGTDYYAAVQKGTETLILKAYGKKWNVYTKK